MTCALIDSSSPLLSGLNFSASEQGSVNAHIAAATAAISRACGDRQFFRDTFDEVIPVGQMGRVILGVFPLASLDRVYCGSAGALQISNTEGTVTNAAVSTTATGLQYSQTAAGVSTSGTLLYSTNPTLTDLATAINGLGNGWAATVLESYGPYASSDLLFNQYFSCKAAGSLSIWTQDSSRFAVESYSAGLLSCCLSEGQLIRVVYTAGWLPHEIPDDLKQVCAEIVAEMMGSGTGAIQQEVLGGYSYTLAQGVLDRLAITSKQILAKYKDRRV